MYVYSVTIIEHGNKDINTVYKEFIVLDEDYYLKELIYLYTSNIHASYKFPYTMYKGYKKLKVYNDVTDSDIINEAYFDPIILNSLRYPIVLYTSLISWFSTEYFRDIHNDILNDLKDKYAKKEDFVVRTEDYIYARYNNEMILIDDFLDRCYIIKFKPNNVIRLFRDVYIDICISFNE